MLYFQLLAMEDNKTSLECNEQSLNTEESVRTIFQDTLSEVSVDSLTSTDKNSDKAQNSMDESQKNSLEKNQSSMIKTSEGTEVFPKKKISFKKEYIDAMSYSEIVDAVGLLLQQEDLPKEKEISLLEQAFSKKKELLEQDEYKKEALQDLKIQASRLNDLIADYRIRYKEQQEEQQRKEQEALTAKKNIVTRLQDLVKSTEEFGTITRKFREIETEWKAIGFFNGDLFKELQDQFSSLRDSFYDLKQLNDEFRDLDFKKNLEAKEELIARATELTSASNPISANREIGDLHAKWKEIGPVAKELRDEIWERFVKVSSTIRDRYQDFLNNRKDEEDKNFELKSKICESIEDIDYDGIKDARAWNEKKKEVIKAQQDWKEIGSVPRNESNAIYKRFRAACDLFFSKRSLAFKEFYDNQDENYRAKLAIVEEAESLVNSTDWSKTTERLKTLQKEWNSIGFPGAKHRDLWPRFRTACDTFFNTRKERSKERRKEESAILEKKRGYIDKAIEMLSVEITEDPTEKQTFADSLFKLIEDFKAAGHLSLKYTQKVHDKFYSTTNEIFKKWKLDQSSRKLENFAEKIDKLVEDCDKDKLRNEMTYNIRKRDKLAEELKNAKGSIQLITSSSNWGNNVLKDIEKQNKSNERELALLEEKIELLRKALARIRSDK